MTLLFIEYSLFSIVPSIIFSIFFRSFDYPFFLFDYDTFLKGFINHNLSNISFLCSFDSPSLFFLCMLFLTNLMIHFISVWYSAKELEYNSIFSNVQKTIEAAEKIQLTQVFLIIHWSERIALQIGIILPRFFQLKLGG